MIPVLREDNSPAPKIMQRQLVKEGIWLVPEAERPAGWESMPVGGIHVELCETKTTEMTKKITETREMVIHSEPQQAEVPALKQREIQSPIPERTELDSELVNTSISIHCESDTESESKWESDLDRIADLSKEIHTRRLAAKKADKFMRSWITRNYSGIRHIGVKSAPITDLWLSLHQLLVECENEGQEALKKK
jgi:hypothetical protein